MSHDADVAEIIRAITDARRERDDRARGRGGQHPRPPGPRKAFLAKRQEQAEQEVDRRPSTRSSRAARPSRWRGRLWRRRRSPRQRIDTARTCWRRRPRIGRKALTRESARRRARMTDRDIIQALVVVEWRAAP